VTRSKHWHAVFLSVPSYDFSEQTVLRLYRSGIKEADTQHLRRRRPPGLHVLLCCCGLFPYNRCFMNVLISLVVVVMTIWTVAARAVLDIRITRIRN